MLPYLLIFFITAIIAFIRFDSPKKVSPYLLGLYVFALDVFAFLYLYPIHFISKNKTPDLFFFGEQYYKQ